MSFLFNTLIHDPLYNALVFFYNTVAWQDFGIAIILTTILLKLLLIPLSKQQIESQKKMQELQPKIKEIQKKYAKDKEKQAKEMMQFYKENKVNPLGGCLPLIIQLIFLIAIYHILLNISNAELAIDQASLYSFVDNPGSVNPSFLGIIDLTKPNVILAIITAAAQYWQTKMLMAKHVFQSAKKDDKDGPDFAQMMTKQMLYIGPILTLFIGISFGAGLIIYWLVSTLFMIGQQWYLMSKEQRAEQSTK